MAFPEGTIIGRYEIRSLLGAGGMGEVYLAHDTQLRRSVALKLLPARFAEAENRLRRFRQEAYAVASLSHPNIAHIYEIGSDKETNFIAMEFVDGETLSKKIHRNQTDLIELLQFLTQVADGLAKAHSARIVHRDLKPDNIMITREGYAKILDFGLAKLVRSEMSGLAIAEGLSDLPTAILAQHSVPGTILGTVGYMSPEQARGQTAVVDYRSDIFSFGCILYECATRRMAFQGESDLDTLHKILYDDVPSISDYNPSAPPELQRIVRRCLAKDPDERYQAIKNVATDLREFQSEMQPVKGSSPDAVAGTARTQATAARETAPSKINQRKSVVVFALSILLVAFAAVAYYLWSTSRANRGFTPPEQHLISTFSGSHRSASFSPDGNSIVFINEVDKIPQVFIKSLSASELKQVTFGDAYAARPRWSPNGDQIAYERRLGDTKGIWLVRPDGGEPRKVIEGGRNVNWSWNGKRLVFERSYDIWTANADGSDQRRVEGIPTTDLLLADRSPAFSPDGSLICFFEKDKGPIGDFWIIPSTGGQARRLTFDNTLGGTPTFTPDQRFVVFSSMRAGSRTLWKVPVEGGQPQPVLVSAGEDTEPEISHDGKKLIYTNTRNQFLLTLTDPASGESKTLKQSRVDMVDPNFSPDGNRLLFFEVAGDGEIQIFAINTDGTGLTQITHGKNERNVHPQWSADGSAIYFYQIRPNLSFRKLTIGSEESTELVSGWEWGTHNGARVDPQGLHAVYSKLDKGKVVATMVRDLTTGTERAFTTLLRNPRWSPDGQFIIGSDLSAGRSDLNEVVICPADGGACRTVTKGYYPHWYSNSLIYFYRESKLEGAEEIWTTSPDGAREKKVVELYPLHPIGQFFDVSPAGKIVWIKYQQGRNELWLSSL
jgi:eukaryotic-like serine/threonine-protein kinase